VSVQDLGLQRLAQTDPGVVERVRWSLRRLARSSDPQVRELARDVLSGRRSARDIPTDAVPGDGLGKVLASAAAAVEELSDKDRARLVAIGRAEIEERAEIAQSRHTPAGPVKPGPPPPEPQADEAGDDADG
jgi:hypothetical protein